VWDAIYKSLHGVLKAADLMEDKSSVRAWLELAGKSAMWLPMSASALDVLRTISSGGQRQDLVNPWERTYDLDETRILGARHGDDATRPEAQLQGARDVVDLDASWRMDQTVGGGGEDRLSAESELITGKEDSALGQTATAEYDAKRLRQAILAMTPEERAERAADPVFLTQIDVAAMFDPAVGAELRDLLLHGEGAAHEVARIRSTGQGADGGRAHPWKTVEAVVAMTDAQRADLATDCTRLAAWREAVGGDKKALAQFDDLLETTTAKVGAAYDAASSAEERTPTSGGARVAETARDAFVSLHRAAILAALHDPEARDEAIIKAAHAARASAREAWDQQKDRKKLHLATEGYAIDTAMTSVWSQVEGPIRKAYVTDWQERTGSADDIGSYGDAPRLVGRLLDEWAEDDVPDPNGNMWMMMYRGAGSSGDVQGMVSAIELAPPEIVARKLSSILLPGLDGERPLKAVYQEFAAADAALEAAQDSDEEARAPLEAAREQARLALVRHPVEVAEHGGLLSAIMGQSSNKSLEDFRHADQ